MVVYVLSCIRSAADSIYSKVRNVGAGRSAQQFLFSLLVERKLSRQLGSSSSCDAANMGMLKYLPFYACGEIVQGFGRGSKDLGIPTANFALEVVKSLPSVFQTGIYYGWANVDNGEVYKMVMSVGWNPFYDNKEKSMETHILHNFNRDLYGQLLKICIVGFLRSEKNFESLDELIAAIQCDIRQATELLDSNADSLQLKESPFFKKEIKLKESKSNDSDKLRNGS